MSATRDRGAAWLCRLVIVLAIAGVFGTWRTAGPVSLNGLEGPHNGWLVIIFALIALAGTWALARGSWPGIIAVVGGAAVMIFTAIENLVDDNSAFGGHSGWGIWVTIGASAALGALGVLAAIARVSGPPDL
jgi:hypothetical protein